MSHSKGNMEASELERVLAGIDAASIALEGLETLLGRRLAAAERGSLSVKTVDQIIDSVLQKGLLSEQQKPPILYSQIANREQSWSLSPRIC